MELTENILKRSETLKKRACEILIREEGYTLIETLVAMVLFLSVLIPLGFGVASLLLDRKADELRRALLIAESEMSQTLSKEDYKESETVIDETYLVSRTINLSGELLEIHLIVSRAKTPEKVLLELNKTILTKQ